MPRSALFLFCLPPALLLACSAGNPGDEGSENYAADDACSVVPQDGCPPTHTCVVATIDGATICQSAGAVPRGGSCNGSVDCASGLSCSDFLCRPFCKEASDCGGEAMVCSQVSHGDTPVTGWSVCSLPCNPADPANTAGDDSLVACPSSMGCLPLVASSAPEGATDCFEVGQAGPGAPCKEAADCRPGVACVAEGDSGTCRQLCLTGSTECTCYSFATPWYAAVGGEIQEVGACL